MEAMPVVLDITSDEEPWLEEGQGPKSIDYDWIKEFLGMSDEESYEVVVAHEVKKPECTLKSSIPTPAVKDEGGGGGADDDDDDCVILDGDPENLVTSVDKAPAGSDELLVVGEKGQIACRDYPHSRHLCGNFPFSSTPHERHCNQCHCYVCDSLAPCLKWGTGLSSTDHCHATDKSEMWKTQRKNFKLGKTSPLPASTCYGTLQDVGNPLHYRLPLLHITRLSPDSMSLNQTSRATAMRTCSSLNLIPQNNASLPTIPNSTLQNQVSRPNTIPICSRATNFAVPHGVNSHQSHSVSRQFLGVRNHAIQKERGRGVSSLGSQFLRSHAMPKELGNVRSTLTVNHSTQGSSFFSNDVNSAWQYNRYAPTGYPNNRTHHGQNDVCVPKNVLYPQLSSEWATLNSVSKNATAYETQVYHQSNDNQNFYGSCIQGNDAPSSYMAHLNRNQHLNKHQTGSLNENASGNIIECGITRQDAFQQKPHDESQSESARKADFSAFGSSWTENGNQSISNLQSSTPINQPPNIKESDNQFTESTNFSSVNDIDINNWLFDEADDALAFELDLPSPDLIPTDTGMFLFDFENSWNGLAHA